MKWWQWTLAVTVGAAFLALVVRMSSEITTSEREAFDSYCRGRLSLARSITDSLAIARGTDLKARFACASFIGRELAAKAVRP